MSSVINLDIRKIPLTEFMKAIGYEQPKSAEGNLRIYPAPYDPEQKPTMVINTDTNCWRDSKSGAHGGIYDLAYELTGATSMSDLNLYIAGQMSALRKIDIRHEPDPQVKSCRKMHL